MFEGLSKQVRGVGGMWGQDGHTWGSKQEIRKFYFSDLRAKLRPKQGGLRPKQAVRNGRGSRKVFSVKERITA